MAWIEANVAVRDVIEDIHPAANIAGMRLMTDRM
jgi:hypothetical protein